MMRILNTAMVTTVCLGLATGAWAQSDTQNPSTPSAPAAAATLPAAPAAISATEMKLRTPVTGSDGQTIGVINRISASPDGTVTDVEVALGSKAGIDAKTSRVAADKITVTGGNVSVSMSSEDARRAAIDQGNS